MPDEVQFKFPVTLEALHHLSFINKGGVDKSEDVGCFACEEVYSADQVTDWVDKGRTALCPICGIDSVLPDAWVAITPAMLEVLKQHYFERISVKWQEVVEKNKG